MKTLALSLALLTLPSLALAAKPVGPDHVKLSRVDGSSVTLRKDWVEPLLGQASVFPFFRDIKHLIGGKVILRGKRSKVPDINVEGALNVQLVHPTQGTFEAVMEVHATDTFLERPHHLQTGVTDLKIGKRVQ